MGFFSQFLNFKILKNNFTIHANDDDELVDPHDVLKEECTEKHCKKYLSKLEECNNRVNGNPKTDETCVEEV